MRCPLGPNESGELVVGYAAGTLDARARAAFEHHLKFCEACAEAAFAQQVVWDALDELMPARLLTRAVQCRAACSRARFSRIGRPGSLAASVCRPIKSRIVGTKLKLS